MVVLICCRTVLRHIDKPLSYGSTSQLSGKHLWLSIGAALYIWPQIVKLQLTQAVLRTSITNYFFLTYLFFSVLCCIIKRITLSSETARHVDVQSRSLHISPACSSHPLLLRALRLQGGHWPACSLLVTSLTHSSCTPTEDCFPSNCQTKKNN